MRKRAKLQIESGLRVVAHVHLHDDDERQLVLRPSSDEAEASSSFSLLASPRARELHPRYVIDTDCFLLLLRATGAERALGRARARPTWTRRNASLASAASLHASRARSALAQRPRAAPSRSTCPHPCG